MVVCIILSIKLKEKKHKLEKCNWRYQFVWNITRKARPPIISIYLFQKAYNEVQQYYPEHDIINLCLWRKKSLWAFTNHSLPYADKDHTNDFEKSKTPYTTSTYQYPEDKKKVFENKRVEMRNFYVRYKKIQREQFLVCCFGSDGHIFMFLLIFCILVYFYFLVFYFYYRYGLESG